jgi:hypothetical protein
MRNSPGTTYPMHAEVVSPELALVDPELAERARRALPGPGGVARVTAPAQTPVPLADASSERSRERPWRSVLLVLLVGSLGLNVDLFVEHHSDDAATRVVGAGEVAAAPAPKRVRRYGVRAAQRRIVQPAAPAAVPRRVVRKTLRWPTAAAAVEYDVVIWQGHRRVLDVWTREARLDPAALACPAARKLRPGGRYLWFVYPSFGRGSARHFGPLVKWGTFRAPRSLPCG